MTAWRHAASGEPHCRETVSGGRHAGKLKSGQGDACSACGVSDAACLATLSEAPCCSVCRTTDTHNIFNIEAEFARRQQRAAGGRAPS